MKYNRYFDLYSFNEYKAVEYGFRFENGKYVITKDLKDDSFYIRVEINDDDFAVKVFERPDDEEYLPFNVFEEKGTFVSKIREYADKVVDEIVEKCFVLTDVRSLVFDHVREKYGTVPARPWGDHDEYYTLNVQKNGKWYGLVMYIPYKALKVEKEGKINVMNIKLSPENIASVVDNIHYFPAYHMNKKYWISVILDKDLDMEKLFSLIDESYSLVK